MTLFRSQALVAHPQANNQTPSDTPSHIGPGQLLSQARESWGMSRDQVAATLHLPASTILALEEERYEGLAPAAFIRGYLSGYARLLGLDADKLVAACEMHGCGDPTLAARRSPSLKKGRGETLLRLGSYGILASFVMATMVYWIVNDDYAGAGLPSIPMAAGIASDSGAPRPAPPDKAENNNTSPPPAVSEPRPGLTTGATFTTTHSETLVPAADSPVAAASTYRAVPTRAEAGTGANAGDASTWPTLELEFKADSWIAVRDAGGKRLAWETVKAGSSRHLSGQPPLKVVLGNADAVRVTFAGELFDPAPYTSGHIARFVVE